MGDGGMEGEGMIGQWPGGFDSTKTSFRREAKAES
jgi:hypothetical protein